MILLIYSLVNTWLYTARWWITWLGCGSISKGTVPPSPGVSNGHEGIRQRVRVRKAHGQRERFITAGVQEAGWRRRGGQSARSADLHTFLHLRSSFIAMHYRLQLYEATTHNQSGSGHKLNAYYIKCQLHCCITSSHPFLCIYSFRRYYRLCNSVAQVSLNCSFSLSK